MDNCNMDPDTPQSGNPVLIRYVKAIPLKHSVSIGSVCESNYAETFRK
jgi:hypothetical protein